SFLVSLMRVPGAQPVDDALDVRAAAPAPGAGPGGGDDVGDVAGPGGPAGPDAARGDVVAAAHGRRVGDAVRAGRVRPGEAGEQQPGPVAGQRRAPVVELGEGADRRAVAEQDRPDEAVVADDELAVGPVAVVAEPDHLGVVL